MLKKRFNLIQFFVGMAVSVVVVLGAILLVLQAKLDLGWQLLPLMQTLTLIENKYDGKFDHEQLYTGALRGMVKELHDPYSTYLDKKDYKELSTMTDGFFGGVGMVMGQKNKQLLVVAPIEDTPAYRAGIKTGDLITAIDGVSTAGEELEAVVKKIRGEKGTTVELMVKTGETAPRLVRIVREDIKLKSVYGELKAGKVGYIRITSFSESTGRDFRAKYQELANLGMKGLVLDLRDNPGGLVTSGVAVAKLLVPKGPIVSVKTKDGTTTTEYSDLAAPKYPLAILVNKGTASASEIISGAVQDTKAGKLFGTTTYGKGCVQSIFRLTTDTALKLTIANYYTPSGRSINGVGITPDVLVEPTDDRGTNQLEAAEKYVAEQIAQGK